MRKESPSPSGRTNVIEMFPIRHKQFPQLNSGSALDMAPVPEYPGRITSEGEGNTVQRKLAPRYDPAGNLLPACVRYRKDRPARPYRVEKDVRQPDGSFRSISESFETFAAAKKGVKALEAKIAGGHGQVQTGIGPGSTLTELREDVGRLALKTGLAPNTLADYERAWKIRIEPELGRYQLKLITTDKIEDCIHEWRETAAPSTVCSALAYLSQLLDKAVGKRLIDENPMDRVTRPRSSDLTHVRERALKPFEQQHFLRLLKEAAPEHQRFLKTLLYTGMRFSEAAALQARDVDLENRVLRVNRAFQNDGSGMLKLGPTKGKKTRAAPIPAALLASIESALEGKSSRDFLLKTPNESIFRGSNLRRALSWKSLADELGKPELRFHDLRHTAATNMLDKGVAPQDVRTILGHHSLAVTDMYSGSHEGYASRAAHTLSQTPFE